MLPSSEKVEVLDLIRPFIISHHRKKGESATIRYFERDGGERGERPYSYNFYYSRLL